MIATNSGSRILVLAAIGAALVGCDSVKDVRDQPSTALPPEAVILKGTVTGVSSLRPVVLTRDGTAGGSMGVQAPPPAESNEELNGVTPFMFGTYAAGTPYNITVFQQPRGKHCEVVSGGSGTLTVGVETNIVVNCTNVGTRYSLTVNLTDPSFAASEGAEVMVTTEEAIYRIRPAPGATSVTFSDVLFNPNPDGITGIRGFTWNVAASTRTGGTLNKCPVNPPSNVAGTTITNPTANVTNVNVGACTFTIGGTVAYSLPETGDPTPPPPTGLVLELRDLSENTVRTQAYSGAWNAPFTFNEDGTPIRFVSNRSAVYTVAVAAHPAGMYCVVANPTAILWAPTLTSNPANVTQPSVQCRAIPTADRQLRGVYRHVTSSWQRDSRDTTVDPIVSTYNALDFSRQNTASSNMLVLFENGTYIYGTHANTVQVEHGFYDYNPVAATLAFTLNADTNNSVDFPANFSPANANSPANVRTTTAGMSSLPGAVPSTGTVRRPTLENVDISVPGRITGTFRGSQTLATVASSGTTRETATHAAMGWVLQAPKSVPNQMTGGWLAQDSRRLWVFDSETYYGTHVGVVGVYAMNDACFTMPDVSVSSGLYTRRPSIGGCYPWPRAGTGQSPAYILSGFVESIDFKFPQFIGSGAGQVDIGTLPQYLARIPGGAQATDGRSPSPIYFHIDSPDRFFATASARYFPEEPVDWCNTEILGIRATLNDVPIHKPVYFCRFVP